jgi:MoxR-like ATPase
VNTSMVNASERIRTIQDRLSRVVLGQDDVLRQMLVALLAGGHALIEGVPGVAKTLAIRALARTVDAGFGRIQFTPDLMPSDLTGTNVLDELHRTFVFRPGPIFNDLVLADEINRAPAKTQAALLEAMQERQVTIDGETRRLPPLFTVFASQNPIDYEGTYPLPEAQLDRFLLKIVVPYPDQSTERSILDRYADGFSADRTESFGIEPAVRMEELLALREVVETIHVEPNVRDYITAIVRATREEPNLALGASPRAGVALFLASRAHALIAERDFVTPDDVKDLALPVLRHRVLLTPEAEVEGEQADVHLSAILDRVEAPR